MATPGPEADKLSGGAGDDQVHLGIKDTADGGKGVDYAYVDLTVDTKGEHFTFSSGDIKFKGGGSITGFEHLNITAGGHNDNITAGKLGDVINGGGGDDTLTGGKGGDTLKRRRRQGRDPRRRTAMTA